MLHNHCRISSLLLPVVATSLMFISCENDSAELIGSEQAKVISDTPATPKKAIDPDPVPPSLPTPVPDPVVPEPMEEPVVTKAAIMPEPAVAEEKSDLDILLENAHPMPEFPPLLKLVDNWKNVPERAFPDSVTIKVPLEYAMMNNGVASHQKTAPAGHRARPLKFKPDQILVTAGTNPNMKAAVDLKDTDFKEQVSKKYEDGVARVKARVFAEREKMKAEVTGAVAANASPAAPRNPLAASRPPSNSKFRGDYFPKVRNGKQSEYHDIAMGPIGGVVAVFYDKKEAEIMELWDNGPGSKAGLNVGDLLVGIDGKTFKVHSHKMSEGPTGVPEDLGLAMIEAQDLGKPVRLDILRGEEREEMIIEVELPALPAFSKTYPVNCARSSQLAEMAAERLVELQKDDGSWPSNDYSVAWCGLAMLSTGNPEYRRSVKKVAGYLSDKYDLGKSPSLDEINKGGATNNWKISIVGIFLAEYQLATGDDSVARALQHCCEAMESRIQEKTGIYGHSNSKTIPYGGKGLVIINTHAHLMWALAAQLQGGEWDWTTWDLSYKCVQSAFNEAGAVGYNFSSRTNIQSGARTGSMLTALVLSDKEKSRQRKMSNWLGEYYHEFPDAHAMTSIGLIFGMADLKNSDERAYRKCLDEYRWMFSLVQPANSDHGSYYYGQKHNHGGDGYLNYKLVGNFMTLTLLNSAKNDTLWLFGNREKDWFKK